MALFCLQIDAEKIKFSTNSFLDDNGITCELYPYWKEDGAYLCTKILTREFVLDTPATLMLKTKNGEVIKLEGSCKGENKRSAGVGTGFAYTNMVVSSITTTTGSIQLYPISDEQIEKLKDGIVKIRINTLPVMTEKKFTKDEIGAKLYQKFQEAKKIFIDF